MRSDTLYYHNIAELGNTQPTDWGQWVNLASSIRDEVCKVSMCSEWGVVNGRRKGWLQQELIDPREELLNIWGDANRLTSLATDDGASYDEMKLFRLLYARVNKLALVLGVAT